MIIKDLTDIIFKNKYKQNFDYNFSNLVKLSSSHLILPLLFKKIKKNKKIDFFEKQFIDYLSKIYEINFNRNRELIFEAEEIKKLLITNGIKFEFIKGTKYLAENVYDDIGTRMIGDIDLLVSEDDKKKALLCLQKNDYKLKYNYKIWKTRHIPKLTNSNKLFAVEIHSEIIKYKYRSIMPGINYLKNKNEGEKLIKLCILNSQINDQNMIFCRFSLRSIYDFILISKSYYIHSYIYPEKFVYRSFFILSDELGITEFKLNLSFFEKIYLFRFKLKFKYKIVRILDNLACNCILFPKKIFYKLGEFLFNKSYKYHTIKKLLPKLYTKT